MHAYELQYSRKARQLRLKITSSGEVVVTAPHLCPRLFIDRFVREHDAWIEEKLALIKEHKNNLTFTPTQSGESILVFGQTLKLLVDDQREHHIGVRKKGETLVVTPVSSTEKSITTALEGFLKSTAEKYIIPRTHHLGKFMKIEFGNITLRQQKSRWGSCSSTGNLNFNWRLVHAPSAVIDYVIIHELAHRKQMNHGAKFWEIVAKYDPEYLKHRGYLKRQGMGLS